MPRATTKPITVGELSVFPDLCVRCARPEARRVDLNAGSPQGERSWEGAMAFLVAIAAALLPIVRIARALAGLFGAESPRVPTGRFDEIRVQVPLCKPCEKKGPLEIENADFERARCTIQVHPRFRREFRTLKAEIRAELRASD